MWQLFKGLNQTNFYDLIIGVISMILLFALKWSKSKFSEKESLSPAAKKIFWFLGTARNALERDN